MKNFLEWLKLNEEAKLKGNPGIPGEGEDKNEPSYLRNAQTKGQEIARNNRVSFPQTYGELMPLVNKAMAMMRGKEKQIEKLAKDLIMSEYGSIIEGVAELDIQLVRQGTIDMDESKLKKNQKNKPSEKKDKEEKPKKKGISFKNLFNNPNQEEESPNKDKEISMETHKRKIANNIIQGEAKNTKHIIHSDGCKEGLIEIFGDKDGKEIHKIFDRITKIMDAMDWVTPEDVQKQMWDEQAGGFAGKAQVKWDKKPDAAKDSEEDEDEEKEDEESCPNCVNKEGDINKEEAKEALAGGKARIIAQGIDFPMLIHEAVKGIYELIASAGQAKDIEVAQAVALDADDLFNEMEDLRYGPMIAADLRDFVHQYKDIDAFPNLREHFFGKMILLPSEEFLSLMKGILMKTPEARKKVDDMLDEIVKELKEWELSGHLTNYEEEEEHSEEERSFGDDVLDRITKDDKLKTPTDIDYSKLSKRDLEDEINAALDAGNYELVGKLSKYLKENVRFRRR